MKLGELSQIFDGPHATPTRRENGPYFLNIASLRSGRLDLSLSDHVSADDFTKWTRRVTPQPGDLLFSYETRLGEAALMPGGIAACLGRRMALLRPDRSVVDPRFLLYYYLGPAFQRTISEHTIHGATVPRIGLATMGSWQVQIPPLEEQRAIAEALGGLDDKIAANDRLITAADRLAEAVTLRAVSDETIMLADVASVTMGSSPPGSSYNESVEGVVFYQGVRDFGVRFPSNRVWTTDPVRLAAPGDTLISVRAPVGRTNLANEELCLGRGLAGLRSRFATPMTLFHQVRAAHAAWAPYEAEGTVFGSINKRQLEAIPLPAIRTELAKSLERKLTSLEDGVAAATRENERLQTTRDELLPLLISGKVRVKDAERFKEGVV